LNVDDRRRFEIASLTLALGNMAQSNVLQSASPDALNNLATLATVADPLRYLDRVGPAIGGRSASEVIRRVASDLDSEISRNDARSAAEYELLTAVAIDHPRYYWDRRRNPPTIEYFYVSEVLTVGGHAGKWMTSGLNYRFERDWRPASRYR
jgi:hypothetical protein